jgi:hypothetical protein
MLPENKQNRRYKQINFIGLQKIAILHNTRLRAPDQGSTVDWWTSFCFPA